MAAENGPSKSARFFWARDDIEQRFRVRGGRFTETNAFFTFLIGAVLATGIMTAAHFAARFAAADSALGGAAAKFVERGPTPYAIVMFFCWSLAILWVKRSKLAYQRRLLTVAIVPPERGFVLNRETARRCLEHLDQLTDSPKNFLLLNRVDIALSSLENLGNVTDVSTILSSQAAQDEQRVASSFNLLGGFVWAIPVFGFIGTVLGLAVSIGGFGVTLETAESMENIRDSMKDVVSGLSTAFDTTLVGLVATVVIQILVSFTRRQEAQFLDACDEYCQQHVIRKLRLDD